jgi:hypothetical protein
MKKIFAVLSFVGVLTFASCGGNTETEVTSEDTTSVVDSTECCEPVETTADTVVSE